MWILLVLFLLPVPSFAVTYDIIAGSDLSAPQATQERTSWQAGDTPFNVFSSAGPMVYLPPLSGSRVLSITNGGRTLLTAFDGTVLMDGVTSSYNLSGPSFRSSFVNASIDPRLVNGVTSQNWNGSITAAFWTGRPEGMWDMRAATTLPEPSTLALIGPAIVGLWLWRRRVTSAPRHTRQCDYTSD